MLLDYDRIDNFVEKQQRLGNDVRWDGWTMVFFRPSSRAVYSPSGRYYQERWGFEERIAPGEDGKWSVPNKFVKFTRRTRNRRN